MAGHQSRAIWSNKGTAFPGGDNQRIPQPTFACTGATGRQRHTIWQKANDRHENNIKNVLRLESAALPSEAVMPSSQSDSQPVSQWVLPSAQMGVATQQTSGVLHAGLPEATPPCRLRFLRIYVDGNEGLSSATVPFSHREEHLATLCVFGWESFPLGRVHQSNLLNLGQRKKQLWMTKVNYDNVRKHQKTFWKDPCFSCITSVHNTLEQPTCKPVREETCFPLLPLHYPSSPSMFVLIDFCGVRSLGTAADRPAIHLQFKECSGRSVPFLFELYRTTTSSGALPCQLRGWQGSTCVRQSIFYPLLQPPNQCSAVKGCQFNPYMQNYGSNGPLDNGRQCNLPSGFPTVGVPSN